MFFTKKKALQSRPFVRLRNFFCHFCLLCLYPACLLLLLRIFPAQDFAGKGLFAQERQNTKEKTATETKKDGLGRRRAERVALWGMLPGLGQAYLGNYESAAVQFAAFASALASASHYQRSPDRIRTRDIEVRFDFKKYWIAQELSRQGLLYQPLPLWNESLYDRDLRLWQNHSFFEIQPLIQYGSFTQLNESTVKYGVAAKLSTDALYYSVYSTYRDAMQPKELRGKIRYHNLVLAPFTPRYLGNWRVWILPLVFAVGSHNAPKTPILVSAGMVSKNSYAATAGLLGYSAAIHEEAFFRGFLNRMYSDHLGKVSGALLSSAFFSGIHGFRGDFGIAFASGLYFAWLQHASGGDIRPGIAAHFWANMLGFYFDERVRLKEDRRVGRTRQEMHYFQPIYVLQF